VGAGPGGLPLEEAASLLAETWQAGLEPSARSLDIVVEQESERAVVEAVVQRSRS
jgi:O-acetyl-ADP-ribose deacetylase (regulator of RNase III)